MVFPLCRTSGAHDLLNLGPLELLSSRVQWLLILTCLRSSRMKKSEGSVSTLSCSSTVVLDLGPLGAFPFRCLAMAKASRRANLAVAIGDIHGLVPWEGWRGGALCSPDFKGPHEPRLGLGLGCLSTLANFEALFSLLDPESWSLTTTSLVSLGGPRLKT